MKRRGGEVAKPQKKRRKDQPLRGENRGFFFGKELNVEGEKEGQREWRTGKLGHKEKEGGRGEPPSNVRAWF